MANVEGKGKCQSLNLLAPRSKECYERDLLKTPGGTDLHGGLS